MLSGRVFAGVISWISQPTTKRLSRVIAERVIADLAALGIAAAAEPVIAGHAERVIAAIVGPVIAASTF